MGNVHGNCLNVDVLVRDGSTYFWQTESRFPDGKRCLVHANDAEDRAEWLPVRARLV